MRPRYKIPRRNLWLQSLTKRTGIFIWKPLITLSECEASQGNCVLVAGGSRGACVVTRQDVIQIHWIGECHSFSICHSSSVQRSTRLSACARGGGARAEDTLRQRRAPAPARQAGRQDRVDALELGRGRGARPTSQRGHVHQAQFRSPVGPRSGAPGPVPVCARRAETRKGRTSPIPQRTRKGCESPTNLL